MLPSASAMAQQATGQQQVVVEVIVIPCLPGMKPEECGVKVSANGGTLTFTDPAGVDIPLTPGMVFTYSGAGLASETPQTGTILNFASAGSSSQTATGSTGEAGAAGGGGGAGQTAALPSGGSGSGGSTPAGGGTGSGSGGTFAGGGSVGGSGSNSIGSGTITGGFGTTTISGGGSSTTTTTDCGCMTCPCPP